MNENPNESVPDSNYLQIDRNKSFPPPYIMDLMMGVSAQRRRAYLLQNKYLTPLTFEYAVFSFFFRYCVAVSSCSLILVLWLVLGKYNPIIFIGVLLSFISIYIGYQIAASKNVKSIKEEVIFNSFVNALSLFFAVYTVFDLSRFFVSLFHWLMSSPF